MAFDQPTSHPSRSSIYKSRGRGQSVRREQRPMRPAANDAEVGSSKNSIVCPMTVRTPRPSCDGHGRPASAAYRAGRHRPLQLSFRPPLLARPRWHCVALNGEFWRGLHPGIHNPETGYVVAPEKEAQSRAEDTERTRTMHPPAVGGFDVGPFVTKVRKGRIGTANGRVPRATTIRRQTQVRNTMSLYTIYAHLRISTMHPSRLSREGGSVRLVKNGLKFISKIFFWCY